MPRRYGPDGSRLWNGKAPEDFNQADVYRFMAETESVLQKRRGPASKADPGADGKRGKGGRKGKRHPARPGKGQGGQG